LEATRFAEEALADTWVAEEALEANRVAEAKWVAEEVHKKTRLTEEEAVQQEADRKEQLAREMMQRLANQKKAANNKKAQVAETAWVAEEDKKKAIEASQVNKRHRKKQHRWR
jgi:prophage antirepressor-like protein